MNVTRYQVTCSACGGTSRIEIDSEDRVYWYDVDKVISARKRLDGQWGFQCSCGNNDIMTAQETQMISDQANPKPQEIEQIMQNLIPDNPKFIMETT